MARGPRSGPSTPDERSDQPVTVPAGAELVDPLQIASAGLEEVAEAPASERGAATVGSEPGTLDPLAVLSRAIDQGEAAEGEESEPPKRGLLGRLGRGRAAAGRTSAGSASSSSPRRTADAVDADPGVATDAPHPAPLSHETASDGVRDEEPLVTTWAEDFEVASATGEWPAVTDHAETAADAEHPAAVEAATTPRRRAGRRRRRRDDPVPAQDAESHVAAQAGRDERTEVSTEDGFAQRAEPATPLEADPDASAEGLSDAERSRLAAESAERSRLEQERHAAEVAERARLAAEEAERAGLQEVRQAAQHREEARLAALKVEEDRRRAEEAEGARAEAERLDRVRQEAVERERKQRAAVHVERARLAAEEAEADRIKAERAAAQQAEDDRLEQLRLAAVEAEERRLAAERDEADRIEAERAAAQQAEHDRLEHLHRDRLLTTEQAERDRLEAVRASAQQAERDRLEALRTEEARLLAEQDRQAAESAQRRAEALAATERAEAARVAAQQAEVQQAEAQRADAERAESARLERERAEQERLAVEQAAAVERERQAEEHVARAAVPKPAAPPAAVARSTSSPAGSGPVPRFIEFRSTSVLRHVFGALFVVFAVAAVIGIFRAVSAGSSDVILAAAGLTALAMLSWWALLSWAPPVVSVSNGVLEISRGADATSWDLRDPGTEIVFRGRSSSRSWKATLRGDGGRPVTISSRHVDPAQFVELVEHYQSAGHETVE